MKSNLVIAVKIKYCNADWQLLIKGTEMNRILHEYMLMFNEFIKLVEEKRENV